jgi:hypothetical protein
MSSALPVRLALLGVRVKVIFLSFLSTGKYLIDSGLGLDFNLRFRSVGIGLERAFPSLSTGRNVAGLAALLMSRVNALTV